MSDSITALIPLYRLKMTAENKSGRTISGYSAAVEILSTHLTGAGRSTAADAITRDDIRRFITEQLANHKPATASNRYRALKTFFRWLVDEEHIDHSPVDGVKPPTLPQTPPPIMSPDDVRQLLKACEGRGFSELRDYAIIILLIDTGMRRSEIGNLKLDDIDPEAGIATVTGKGNRVRVVAFGNKAAYAIGRYLLARAKHRDAYKPQLWLGHAGPMTPDGLYQRICTRAQDAGLEGVYTHLFRHTWASSLKADDMSEENVMTLGGWKSTSMLRRYGASAASGRAREAFRRVSPGDKL